MNKRFLFFFLLSGLVLMNACHKEYSLETGNTPSEGTLQDDGTGDCLPKNVVGAYVVGTTLTGTANYIEVQVNVTTIGTYLIYTDTVNGMHFRGSGIFTTMGLNTVRLQGIGTPFAAGISNFLVSYGTSSCTIAVTTVASLAVFTLNGAPGGCMGAVVAGTYTAGTALNASNTVTINVIVTTLGAYNISTVLSNGMIFSGSGVLPTVGPQTIVLNGSGTPTTAGPPATNIPVTAGSSTCSFTVTVVAAAPPATYTVDCTSAVPNGTYTQNTALTASNTVSIGVNVTVIGSYNITTTTTNGMTFSATGNFAATGAQTVTLAGSGTPTIAGANTIPVPSGTTACNFTVTVVAAAGAATFTVNCGTAVPNGTYTQNTALTAANTVTIGVTVAVIGTYNITTTTTNGITFSATGNFAATGAQTVTLAGTGTPTVAGANTIPVPSGTTACNFTITVVAAAGAATFTVNCGTAVPNGTYTQNAVLTAANTVTIGVTVAVIGTYNITTTTTNGMTFSATGNFAATGAQTVTLAGTGTPTVAGANTIPVPSGTTACNFTVTVVASGGAATFAVNCGTAVPNGNYIAGVALTSSNTVTISVTVATAGTYTITTTPTDGITFSASGTFAATGTQNVTLVGSGTPVTGGTTSASIGPYTIPVISGTAPCNFSLPVNFGSWSFKEGSTTFSGVLDYAEMDPTTASPALLFYFAGPDAAGDAFEIDLLDISGAIQNGETYSGAATTPVNAGGFYFNGPAPTSAVIYQADPSFLPNSISITVTSHNTATKKIVGTFSGTAQDGSGNPKIITLGSFTVTYP